MGRSAKTPDVVPSASDQFTSLLEGLDALASAIQGAVESRASVQEDEAVVAVPTSIDG